MDNLRLTFLFEQQLSKKLSASEELELRSLLASVENEEQVKNLFESVWTAFNPQKKVFSAAHSEQMLTEILQSGKIKNIGIKKLTTYNKYIAAAVLLITLSAGLYFYQHYTSLVTLQDLNARNRITPGGNQAILTLSNGKQVTLSKNRSGVIINKTGLTYTDGTAIPATSFTEELLTVSTPKGGTYQVTLSDGTLIWLNASSSLKFPASFKSSNERKVELDGEAYFEVKHQDKQPFRVYTARQVTEDIGTAFNINAYRDEASVKTTLLEGSVKVNQITLKPNQQSILTGTGINVIDMDASLAVDWKNGEFMFKNENLKSIMRKISRWYNVDVEFQDNGLEKETFSGSVSRYERVSEILKVLELTDRVRFRMEGRKVIVIK